MVYDAEETAVDPASDLPRFSVQGDFTVPGDLPHVNVVVSVVVTDWSGSYMLDIPYQASVVETGVDVGYRAFPFPEQSEAYTGVRVRPYGELGMGVRGVGLFQQWWTDIGRLGWEGHVGMGAMIGGKHDHVSIGAKYEAVLAGTGEQGILDTGAQDMTWTWNPSAARLYVLVGVGCR